MDSFASLIAQLVKNQPATQETPLQFLGWEDPLEKGKATHSSILAWRIPWTIESMGLQRVVRIFTFTAFVTILLLFWFFVCLFCFFTARQLGSQFPNQGSNLRPPPLGGEVWTTGQSGKSWLFAILQHPFHENPHAWVGAPPSISTNVTVLFQHHQFQIQVPGNKGLAMMNM